ncbi:hypothetical protein [Streptomyces sp. CMB-StM0423]|uniref:hypothetical protein n=1 Tax=Streptomyces sp. CMB-StM0423 TaxID=2059884 RepID=UPI0018FEBDBD|nr:hypothetical protein [Streptomyces sp. CMB-StM0423]
MAAGAAAAMTVLTLGALRDSSEPGGVGTTTACRSINEAVDPPGSLAPTLAEAARTASMKA